jgi:hypothetical protein
MSTILDHRSPVARKTHQCDLCLCDIEPGERYELGTYCNPDNGVYRFKMHEDCARIGARMTRVWDLPDGYRDEDLMEWLFGGYFEPGFHDEDDLRVKARIEARRAARMSHSQHG